MFRYKLEMLMIKIFIGILKIFSEKMRYKFSEKIAVLAYKMIRLRREITHKNIKIAFPNLKEEEVKRIAIESYKNMVKSFMIPFWLPEFVKTPDKIRYQNEEIVDNAYARGEGIILISLHMGYIDGNIKLTEKFNLSDVVRRQKNPYLDKYMNDIRRNLGLNIIYKGKQSARELIKAIKSKEAIGLFSDHYDRSGIEIEFFGKKTRVSTGAINLALRYDTPIVFAYNLINKDNSSTICFSESFELEKTDNIKQDVEINTKKMIKKMEEIIKQYPEQWMWFHRRWRD